MNWENPHPDIDQLNILNSQNPKLQKAIKEIQMATASLTGPEAIKILTAIAAEVSLAVESRNDTKEIKETSTALKAALNSMEAVNYPLDG
ncbi:hypothetical protein [uncultured Photobacterium sp.]|uniref:hypothetical protein n=1 Tax=uncultured Photobacterium sp. TaxID=173973 RepID=UPI0026154D2E|nr:hypothetical protein [uncultured Photobacterium sp.]